MCLLVMQRKLLGVAAVFICSGPAVLALSVESVSPSRKVGSSEDRGHRFHVFARPPRSACAK